MPREEVSTQSIGLDGVTLDLQEPPADGDVIDSGRVALFVQNDSGASVTVTVQTTATVNGLDVEDAEVSVADGDLVMIGPFDKSTFGRDEDSDFEDRVYVDYDGTVTRTVVRF